MTEKNERLECRCCDGFMEPARSQFTVVKKNAVYIVDDVPSLQCSLCGEIVYDGETASQLERLTSGRITARAILNAWVYNFDDAVLEISKGNTVSSTELTDVEYLRDETTNAVFSDR